MPLSQADRIAFSSQIVTAKAQIAGIALAQAAVQNQINKLQALDTANKNLFTPINSYVNSYQSELQNLDGNGRTQILEQDIQDSANHKLGNFFFPNDSTIHNPDLAPVGYIWSQTVPFALGYGIGRNILDAYTPVPFESSQIATINAYVTNFTQTPPAGYSDFDLTTGTSGNGMCSIVTYTDEVTCVANSGIWTPSGGSSPDPNIDIIKNQMITYINALKATANNGLTALTGNTDTNPSNITLINAAITNVNTFIAALNTWLAYPDYEVTGAGPSKLHSVQLIALKAAFTARNSFTSTRITQINMIIGTVSQNITNGTTSGSGMYLNRYNYLSLRLNLLGGSLSQLAAAQGATGAQNAISANIVATAAIYQSFLPTSLLQAPGNGTAIVHLVDVSFISPGQAVFVMADNQQELLRAVRSITGDAVTLNDVVPATYSSNVRLYRDLT